MEDLKRRYGVGGLGDVALKRHLIEVLESFSAPIQRRGEELRRAPEQIIKILREGTERGRAVAHETRRGVRHAMQLDCN